MVSNVQIEILPQLAGWISVIRTAFFYKTGMAVLVALGFMFSGTAQAQETPSKELLQYIYTSKSQGVSDGAIRRAAVANGWARPTVDEALAFAKKNKPPEPQTKPP